LLYLNFIELAKNSLRRSRKIFVALPMVGYLLQHLGFNRVLLHTRGTLMHHTQIKQRTSLADIGPGRKSSFGTRKKTRLK